MTTVLQRFTDLTNKILCNDDSKCIKCKKFYGSKDKFHMCSLCFYKFTNISPPISLDILNIKKYWKNFKFYTIYIMGDGC